MKQPFENKSWMAYVKVVMALLTILLIMGCETPEMTQNPKGQPAETEANLTVSIYQLEQTPFAAISRAAVSSVCSRLNFALYDMTGNRVKQTNQQLGDADFGTASFQLAKGDYQLVIVAHSSKGNPTMTNAQKIQFSNDIGYTDTFLYNEVITVGDSPLTIPATLQRIVSLCRFVITDDYPQEVALMRFVWKGGSGSFDASTGFGSVNSTQKLEVNASAAQKQFDLYTFLHDTTGTIHLTVTAHDANDNVLNEHEFDVPMTQNQISWLSGSYFSDSNTQSLSLSLDVTTEWAGENYYSF